MNSNYQVLKNHMQNAQFLASAALTRIEVLANELKISETEREELITLAKEKGITHADTTEGRIEALELAVLDLGAMVAEIMMMMMLPEPEVEEVVGGAE
jgi:hypothetical protein